MSPGPALAGGAGAPVPLHGVARNITPDLHEQFRSMACEVSIRVVEPTVTAWPAMERARAVFAAVEQACTRFDPASPLMRANATPEEWHQVPAELFDAISEAHQAHLVTDGLFDPRVLRVLEGYGYDRTLPFAAGPVSTCGAVVSATMLARSAEPADDAMAWAPGFDHSRSRIRLGPEPVDLGGIGKGLAVRWAAEQLAPAASSFLVEAGGDCYASGLGPEGTGWRVGVEDPCSDGPEPVAVLRLVDQACTTSSTRLRHWRSNDVEVHHLIDPRTGRSAAGGLAAVTVIADDPAWAEVWSKTLFLTGQHRIEESASHHSLAAVWVNADGGLGWSAPAAALISWRGR
jgi:thiamine biosynthesis lipoprotein